MAIDVNETATHAAVRLLGSLDVDPLRRPGGADHPAIAWRRAGLMAVTGHAEGPGLVCPAPLASAADGALLALRALAPNPDVLPQNGAVLLGERARMMGLRRQGRISANGTCRLVDTADGRIALSLAREEDRDLLPFLFMADAVADWAEIEHAALRHAAADLMARGIELGLPMAQDVPVMPPDMPFSIRNGIALPSLPARAPLVLDFAALWAGPLAASLLAMLGADVVKVESIRRLDGSRRGHGGFYDLLNGAKRSVAIDFADPEQFCRLLALVERADIVIEGSRPRALKRLGIDRDAVVARGGIWVSITGHDDPDRVGFGDDAAIGGGLATHMAKGWGAPMFAGDAIADPLTGMHGALAAWALWQAGRSGLVHLSLSLTLAYACGSEIACDGELLRWQSQAENDAEPLYPMREAPAAACQPGTHNSLLGAVRT